jgi:hypothetical protein
VGDLSKVEIGESYMLFPNAKKNNDKWKAFLNERGLKLAKDNPQLLLKRGEWRKRTEAAVYSEGEYQFKTGQSRAKKYEEQV